MQNYLTFIRGTVLRLRSYRRTVLLLFLTASLALSGWGFLPVKEQISLNPEWEYADLSAICTGSAMLYRAKDNRKTPKRTKGTNPAGSLKAVAISLGMTFLDGTTEAEVTLRAARALRDRLLLHTRT